MNIGQALYAKLKEKRRVGFEPTYDCFQNKPTYQVWHRPAFSLFWRQTTPPIDFYCVESI
jgi:hypothetical protein